MMNTNDGINRATAMVFKKAIPRRTFLRGTGAALALGIVRGAAACHAGMATFDEAGVSDKD